MAKEINFKDYTRIRDIVVKRNKRGVEAGLVSPVHFPTVKEIKSGFIDAREAWRAIENYYSSGSQVKTIRQTGIRPPEVTFPVMPEPEKLSEEVKRERRRRQQRDYRRRVKIDRSETLNSKQKDYYKRFLKAVSTMKAKGFELGFDPDTMTPTEALAFTEYLDYRFSQGDFKLQYIIDEFVEQFAKLKEAGVNVRNIKRDFDLFLDSRKVLREHESNLLGIAMDEVSSLWEDYVESKLLGEDY